MKLALMSILVGGALLLVSAPESRALSPRQHSVSGVIASIDYGGHTITLRREKGGKPFVFVFVWKDHTRFSQGGDRICLGALEPGQPVRISYRREPGQLVTRRVSLRSETPTRCAAGECCAKRS